MAFLGGVKTINRSEVHVMRQGYLRNYGKKRVDFPGSPRTTVPPTAKRSRVDSNVWGQNTWFDFSVSLIYSSLALLLLMLPAIAFLWFVCRSPTEPREIAMMISAGLTYFLVVSLISVWLNYTSSAPGNWSVNPFLAPLVIGLVLLPIEYGYRWMTTKRSMRINRASEEGSLSQHVCDFIRSQDPCKALS